MVASQAISKPGVLFPLGHHMGEGLNTLGIADFRSRKIHRLAQKHICQNTNIVKNNAGMFKIFAGYTSNLGTRDYALFALKMGQFQAYAFEARV